MIILHTYSSLLPTLFWCCPCATLQHVPTVFPGALQQVLIDTPPPAGCPSDAVSCSLQAIIRYNTTHRLQYAWLIAVQYSTVRYRSAPQRSAPHMPCLGKLLVHCWARLGSFWN